MDSDEVAVIDDEVITAALLSGAGADGSKAPRSAQNAGSASPPGLADLVAGAATLKLSFKNVRDIDNLIGFQNLTKLCLDNNIIRGIANLDHLVNLTWLDLSFNCISKMAGLSKLSKLTDLSLFNNQIAEIDGLEHCRDLQCLSLGNNQIAALDSVVKLRAFKKLQLLNLEGNPVSKEGEYRMYVLAYLHDLTYFDFSMVLKAETVAAREQYQDELLDVEEKEALEEEKHSRDLAAKKHTAKLVEANLAVVETVFSDMFAADDSAALRALPGFGDPLQSFQSEVESASDSYLQTGLAKFAAKQRACSDFEGSLLELRTSCATESIRVVETFLRFKKRSLKELLAARPHVEESDLAPLRTALAEVADGLMDLEVGQVEKFEDLIDAFEKAFLELKSLCLDAQQGFFRIVEEHENNYSKDCQQVMADLLEKAAKDDLPSDLPEACAALLADRDAAVGAVTSAHDAHVGKLYKREDEAKTAEEAHCRALFRRVRDGEHSRNRARVLELQLFQKTCANELHDLVTRNDDDDEGDLAE